MDANKLLKSLRKSRYQTNVEKEPVPKQQKTLPKPEPVKQLADKYVPVDCDKLIGRQKEISNLRKWFRDTGAKSKMVVLYGPPGTGKTLMLDTYLKNNFRHVIHLCALDVTRTKKQLEKTIKNIHSRYRDFAIVFDDADCFYEQTACQKLLVEFSKLPQFQKRFFCTANDSKSIDVLRRSVFVHKIFVPRYSTNSVQQILVNINQRAPVKRPAKLLDDIANACNGDARSAIISLQFGHVQHADTDDTVFDGVKQVLENIDSQCDAIDKLTDNKMFVLDLVHTNVYSNLQNTILQNEFGRVEQIAEILSDVDILRQCDGTELTLLNDVGRYRFSKFNRFGLQMPTKQVPSKVHLFGIKSLSVFE